MEVVQMVSIWIYGSYFENKNRSYWDVIQMVSIWMEVVQMVSIWIYGSYFENKNRSYWDVKEPYSTIVTGLSFTG